MEIYSLIRANIIIRPPLASQARGRVGGALKILNILLASRMLNTRYGGFLAFSTWGNKQIKFGLIYRGGHAHLLLLFMLLNKNPRASCCCSIFGPITRYRWFYQPTFYLPPPPFRHPYPTHCLAANRVPVWIYRPVNIILPPPLGIYPTHCLAANRLHEWIYRPVNPLMS